MAGPDAQRDARYKPAEVCRLADVQPYVLRYWESEFPFLAPDRNAPGPRSYSEQDLQLIRRIKQLLYDEGYTIAGAKKKLEVELKKGVPLFDDSELASPEPADLADERQAPLAPGVTVPFDPDDTGAGAPPPKPKRKAKVSPPPPPPPPDDLPADVVEEELGMEPEHARTPPPLPPRPAKAPAAVVPDPVEPAPPQVVTVDRIVEVEKVIEKIVEVEKIVVQREKDPRVAEAIVELKEILAILEAD